MNIRLLENLFTHSHFLKSNISSKTLESFKSFDASKCGERKLNLHATTKTSKLYLVDMGKNNNSLEILAIIWQYIPRQELL